MKTVFKKLISIPLGWKLISTSLILITVVSSLTIAGLKDKIPVQESEVTSTENVITDTQTQDIALADEAAPPVVPEETAEESLPEPDEPLDSTPAVTPSSTEDSKENAVPKAASSDTYTSAPKAETTVPPAQTPDPVPETPAPQAETPAPEPETTSPAPDTPSVDVAANDSQKSTYSLESKKQGNSVIIRIPQSSGKTEEPAVDNEQPVPSTPDVQTGGSYNQDYANQVLSIVNSERANAGLPSLTMSSSASEAAKVRAKEIISSFSHTRPSGQTPFTALDEFSVSYRAAGENIAYGQRTPDSVMTGWMNSSGHRANILNQNFTQVGIACYIDSQSGTPYWVQLFIG